MCSFTYRWDSTRHAADDFLRAIFQATLYKRGVGGRTSEPPTFRRCCTHLLGRTTVQPLSAEDGNPQCHQTAPERRTSDPSF